MHDLTLLSASSAGSWAKCSCGWESRAWPTTVAAHLAFGRHLTTTREADMTDDEGAR